MSIVDNAEQFAMIEKGLDDMKHQQNECMIMEPFTKDFSLRFCWSSNALEGNTLNLEETIAVLEYDEVRGGHTYSEYEETKNLYRAIQQFLVPFKQQVITEEWLKSANGIIRGVKSDYRTGAVYIGTIVEAVYYPPSSEKVPELMKAYLLEANNTDATQYTVEEIMEQIATQHIQFEQIHPFQDGNGRLGRMILNQQLINFGLLPITIEVSGKYRQAFRQFQKNKDKSLMTHILCKGELDAIERIQFLMKQRE